MRPRTDKAVPKSLHTVTAIVQVARHILSTFGGPEDDAVDDAMQILGLAMRDDPHLLRDTALRQLSGRD